MEVFLEHQLDCRSHSCLLDSLNNVELINVDNSQSPVVQSNEVSIGDMKGHDSFISLSLGILF